MQKQSVKAMYTYDEVRTCKGKMLMNRLRGSTENKLTCATRPVKLNRLTLDHIDPD